MHSLYSFFLALQGNGETPAPAEGAPTEGAPQSGGFPLLLIVGMFAIFWFVMIGPERKRRKKHQQMLTELKKGDVVLTTGGVYGEVREIKDDIVHLKVADNVRIRVARYAVQGLLEDPRTQEAS